MIEFSSDTSKDGLVFNFKVTPDAVKVTRVSPLVDMLLDATDVDCVKYGDGVNAGS